MEFLAQNIDAPLRQVHPTDFKVASNHQQLVS